MSTPFSLWSRLSLRARLVLSVAVITVACFASADFAVLRAVGSYLNNRVDQSLGASHAALAATATKPVSALRQGMFVPSNGAPGPGRAQGQGGTGPQGAGGQGGRPQSGDGSAFCAVGRQSAPGMFIAVLTPAGKVVTGVAGREECQAFEPGSKSYTPLLPAKLTDVKAAGQGPSYFTTGPTTPAGPSFRVQASRLSTGDILVVATPLTGVSGTISWLELVEVIVTLTALVAAVGLSLWSVRASLRPLRDIEQTAEAISAGELMHRVPVASVRTEVGHVGQAFNFMLERIEGLFADLEESEARLRRFVGDASHELRTPIAAVSAYAQLFSRGAATRPEDLERVMEGIERESARMTKLVADLLTLARLDEHAPLDDKPLELVDIALEACDTARTVGPAWPVELIAADAVEARGDRNALRQVIDNLLANVRAHTPPGTLAKVTVGRSGKEAFIEVADNGPGITAAEAEVVFERFFRRDPSRSRATGGAGLGLAIVASIAARHGGRATARAGDHGGAVFRLALPALGRPDEAVTGPGGASVEAPTNKGGMGGRRLEVGI